MFAGLILITTSKEWKQRLGSSVFPSEMFSCSQYFSLFVSRLTYFRSTFPHNKNHQVVPMFPKTDSGSLFLLFAKNPWEALKDHVTQWILHLQNLRADLRRLDFRIPFHLLISI